MNSVIAQDIAIYFPLIFAAMWLTITTILAIASGWFRLMTKFPNQSTEPLLRLRARSGTMGLGVGMRGVLTLSVCTPGLRVGMMRLFGPFCREFLVPWEDIAATRKTTLFWPRVTLRFGNPVVGKLTLSADVADRLARAAIGHWPEPGVFPAEKRSATALRLFVQWAAITCFAALFFNLAPLLVSANGNGRPPILATILFPAIVFGIAAVFRFFRASR